MKTIIGLGNPGTKYVHNRHNVGHMFVDFVTKNEELRIKNEKLLKTDCFMNDSGKFVKKKTTDYGLQATDLYVVHDDLDIPLGKFKIQFGVGPKVHNGVESVEQQLGTKVFWRIRIGVDNRDTQNRVSGEEYVLQDFSHEEREILNAVFKEIASELNKTNSQLQ